MGDGPADAVCSTPTGPPRTDGPRPAVVRRFPISCPAETGDEPPWDRLWTFDASLSHGDVRRTPPAAGRTRGPERTNTAFHGQTLRAHQREWLPRSLSGQRPAPPRAAVRRRRPDGASRVWRTDQLTASIATGSRRTASIGSDDKGRPRGRPGRGRPWTCSGPRSLTDWRSWPTASTTRCVDRWWTRAPLPRSRRTASDRWLRS
jgi:hypothetical protein